MHVSIDAATLQGWQQSQAPVQKNVEESNVRLESPTHLAAAHETI